jgi:mono/diheme cytochrome c family protein
VSRALRLVAGLMALGMLAGVAWLRVDAVRTRARLQQGQQLYRKGLGLNGAPIKALVKADLVVDGTMVTCANCHQRAGFGSFEGALVSPPIVGEVLFNPVKTLFKGVEVKGAPPRRPAYTLATLATALRDGVDPTGRKLNEAMPRFELGDDEVAVLAQYLTSLSSAVSPGVVDDTIRLATVVSADAPADERAAMVFALQKFVSYQNSQTQPRVQGLDNRSARMSQNMLGGGLNATRDVAFKKLELAVWEVQGAPDSWRAQLEEQQERRPVFALVGGLVQGPWAPVAAFADAHTLPTLFPVTDLPVLGAEADTATVYLSAGATQEGLSLAHHLADVEQVVELVGPGALEQVRARGFDEARAQLGKPPATRLPLPVDAAKLPAGVTVVLWSAPGVLTELEALAALGGDRAVYASAVAVGAARATLSADARKVVRFTWPARATDDERAFLDQLRPWLKDSGERALDHTSREYAVAASAYAGMQVLALAMMDLRGHYTGDALLDVLGMLKDQKLPYFERLSFGVGQRYASKGAWVVEVGAQGEFLKRSEWLTH